MRYIGILALLLAACGCASQKDPPERELVRDPVQLTSGFERAGEAYFSPDQQWMIFQAVPKGEHNYQMYHELYMMDDDGRNQNRVTYHDGADVLPVFSPDMWTNKRSADGSAQIFIGRFAMSEAK